MRQSRLRAHTSVNARGLPLHPATASLRICSTSSGSCSGCWNNSACLFGSGLCHSFHIELCETLLTLHLVQNPQSWVSPETADISARLPVRREHITVRSRKPITASGIMFRPQFLRLRILQGRSALSKPADKSPTPVSVPRESILSELVEATASSVPSASSPATSPGPLRVSPARSV